MFELNSQENVVQEADIAYGNKFLRDDFSIGKSNIGSWDDLPQKPQIDHNFEVSITPTVYQIEQNALINDWYENKDPLTQADLLKNEDDKVQELIFQIRKSLFIRHQKSLANRLLTLFNDAKEEDSDSLGIAVGSIRNFYLFFRLHSNLKLPNISLTPDYNIYTSWRGEQNRLFSVHFLPNGDARFVIFKPNDKHPERQIRLSGITTTDILMETVPPNSVREWISE